MDSHSDFGETIEMNLTYKLHYETDHAHNIKF